MTVLSKIIILVLLLSVLNTASASITINADKTISIDGVKTFPVFTYSICEQKWFNLFPATMNCSQNVLNNSNATFDFQTYGTSSFINSTIKPAFNPYNILWTKEAWNSCVWCVTEPGFFGYYQVDESYDTAALASAYNARRSQDPAHPVIFNGGLQEGLSMTASQPYADILTWDRYTFVNESWATWNRNDSLYAWELISDDTYLRGAEPNSMSKPVWTILAAVAQWNPSGKNLILTNQEFRGNYYAAITLDVKGIGLWAYYANNGQTLASIFGTYKNKPIAQYHNQIMGEIHSLNDILVLPTDAYRWSFHENSTLAFSELKYRTVCNGPTHCHNTSNFNWIKKHDDTTGKTYLIIVNKDNNPVNNVVITVAGLSGEMTATTLGYETSGSAKAGITHTVSNGVFTDTFDGFAAHVYEISSTNTSLGPVISAWGNTKTNNASTSFNLNTSESITFNATANQTITIWNWYNNGQKTVNNTNSYTVSYSTGGTKIISVSANNSNGTSNIITWIVSVSPTSSTYSKIGLGGVSFSSINSNFNHAVVNKGDGKVTIGLLADNCNDGISDWGHTAWTCSNGVLTPSNTQTRTEAWQNLSIYTDVTLFLKTNESVLNTWDATLRSLSSMDSIYKRYYFGKTATTDFIQNYIDWAILNSTATSRTTNTNYYNIFDVSGTTLNYYTADTSFANARNRMKLTAINSSYSSGDYISLSGTNISFDDIRLIEFNRFSGSINVNYDAGTNNQTNGVIINTTTPANTNYTVIYRQKYTGDWVPIGGTHTGNQTLSISGTRYQDTEINITLFGNGTSFPDIETIEFTREQVSASLYPRYDVDENGIVDMDDLTIVGQHFNEVVSAPYPRYDVNMDGLVNIDDITIVGQHFGENV